MTWDKYAEVLVAIGTLALATATIYSIRASNKREKIRVEEQRNTEVRDRKEKLYNEIIKWSIEILREYTSLSQYCDVFYDDKGRPFVNDEEDKLSNIYKSHLLNSFQALRDQGKYITKIASSVSLSTEENVKELWELLTKLIGLLEKIRIGVEFDATIPSVIEIDNAINGIAPLCNNIISETAKAKLGLADIN